MLVKSSFSQKGAVSDMQEPIPFLRARGDGYRLLAACFYPPKMELLLDEGLLRNLTDVLSVACPAAALFSAAMEETGLSSCEEDLAVEYARLFLGPFELKAPPYGSFYLDEGKRVMGNSTMEVLKIYKEEGLVLDEEFKELPDHIAAELEFMYYLIFREVKAWGKNDKDAALHFLKLQKLFLGTFLFPWIGPFCERIIKGTQNAFYGSLAKCAFAFITHHQRAGNNF